MRVWYLVLVFLICNVIASAQKNFSEPPNEFFAEIQNFLEEGKSDDDTDEELLNLFVEKWQYDSVSFDSAERQYIIQVSNALLKKKARPSPHFFNFLKDYFLFYQNVENSENFAIWKKATLDYALNEDVKLSELNDFLEQIDKILEENILYQSSSVEWRVSGNTDYNFAIEDGQFSVILNKVDLACLAKRDSIQILEVEAKYIPILKILSGNHAKITWERAGYRQDQIYAILPKYDIDVTKSRYQVDSAIFYNSLYFDEPLTGLFEDNVKLLKSPEDATYPKFTSYNQDFHLDNIYENVNYSGGLSMQGAKMIGTGTEEETAQLDIFDQGVLILSGKSNYIIFREDRVIGINASIVLHIEEDSIYHPDLKLTYRINNRELSLIRTEDFTSQSPCFNSYHALDIGFEQIYWKIGEPEIKFTMLPGSTIGNATFESINFFNIQKFYQIQMRDEVHPLVALKSFAKKYGSQKFPVEAFADYMKRPLHLVKQYLMRLAYQGFVFYDVNNQMITVKQRTYDYLFASIGRIDYDAINLKSTTNAPLENAVLDIRTFDLVINGVNDIYLSDSQNVVIHPRNSQIVMKRDRSFQFDGEIIAGLFTFFGSNFFFDYDDFKINLQNIDSVKIRYISDEVDQFGLPIIKSVENQIENLTGELFIDNPSNKSGVKPFSEYPIFESLEKSYVYYDAPHIEGGVYNRLDFYFEVDTFTIDSLDNFTKEALQYNGKFASGDIFPEFRYVLSIQPDNTLGFAYNTPEEGLPMYKGKSKFTHKLTLNKKGLRGAGQLNYLSSITRSDDFKMYIDSTNAYAQEFNIEKTTVEPQFPYVSARGNYVHYLPYQDQFFTDKRETDFTILNDSTTLSGELFLTPKGLSGAGKMDLKNSELLSSSFTYKANEIYADTANFALKSLKKDGYTIFTDNVSAHVDYNNKNAEFKSNDEFTLVEFTENKYISFLDYFKWDMVKAEVFMGRGSSTPFTDQIDIYNPPVPEGARYVSVDPKQDSVNFVSPLASYDYKTNVLKATDVYYIEVADALIFPDKGKVNIREDGYIAKLFNTKILANTLTKYHTLHSAEVSIQGKKEYQGAAKYDYIDETGKSQLITFKEVDVDTAGNTVAQGNILEEEDFTLSPVYAYQGKVSLNAPDKYLTFKGSALIEHNCETLTSQWLFFESQIDPEDIYIPVTEEPVNINRHNIYNGVFMANDSIHLFSSFLSYRKNYSDAYINTSHGYLYYDKNTNLYKIASKDKILDFTIPGNYQSLNKETCEHYGEGEINLNVELGQLKLKSAGYVRRDVDKNYTRLNILMKTNFFLGEEIIPVITHDFDSLEGRGPVDLDRPIYTKGIADLIGATAAEKFNSEMSLFGLVKEYPEELKDLFVFNELQFEWNDETNSFQSMGDIGILSIAGKQINKKYEGFIEIMRKRSGDNMDIYLKLDDNTWYYFGYTRGVMQVLTTNTQVLTLIKELKPGKRKLKVKRNETSYIYITSTDRKANMFINRYNNLKEYRESQK